MHIDPREPMCIEVRSINADLKPPSRVAKTGGPATSLAIKPHKNSCARVKEKQRLKRFLGQLHNIGVPGLIPAPTFGRHRLRGWDASMTPAGFTLRVLPRCRLCDAPRLEAPTQQGTGLAGLSARRWV